MSAPNGQAPQEPVNFPDVLEYWRDLTMDLHSRLSIQAAQMKNRERLIEHLQSKLNERSEETAEQGE